MSSRRCPAYGWDTKEWRPIYRKGVYLTLCLLTHGNLAVPQTIRQKQSNGRCSWVCNIRLFIADSHCWLLLMLTYINIRRGLRRCSSRRIGRCQSLHVWDEWLWDSHAFFVYQPFLIFSCHLGSNMVFTMVWYIIIQRLMRLKILSTIIVNPKTKSILYSGQVAFILWMIAQKCSMDGK